MTGRVAEVTENFPATRFVRIPAGALVMGTECPAAARREAPEPAGHAARRIPARRVDISQPVFPGGTGVHRLSGCAPGRVHLRVAAESGHLAARCVEEFHGPDPDHRHRLPGAAAWGAARVGTAGLRPLSREELKDNARFINNPGEVPRPVATRRLTVKNNYRPVSPFLVPPR